MKKHLYIFTEADSNAGAYGVGSYIRKLTDALSIHESYKVTIVSIMTIGSIVKVTDTDGLRKIDIPKLTPPTSSRRNYFQSVYYILYPYIDQCDINFFHFNFFTSSKLARVIKEKIEGAKLLFTVHYFKEFNLLETGTDEDFRNCLYDRVIALNRTTEAILLQKYLVDPKILVRIPNGVKDEFDAKDNNKRSEILEKLGLLNNDLHLLFVGRLDDNKNVGLLIRVFIKLCSAYKNIHLNIVGSGDFELAFREIDQLWGKISFFGKLNKENVYKLYQIADIGIVPSIIEELGYVAIEMMMYGLPVIANNTGGLSDLVTDNVTGLLFQINNSGNEEEVENILYQKVESLIVDVKLRHRLGENARSFYLDHLTSEIYQEKMSKLYSSII